jgi:Zn-dependent alcohol dehydrogenase
VVKVCVPSICLFFLENPYIHIVRATQGQGLMPDKTSRFSINGQKVFHFVCMFVTYLSVEKTNTTSP